MSHQQTRRGLIRPSPAQHITVWLFLEIGDTFCGLAAILIVITIIIITVIIITLIVFIIVAIITIIIFVLRVIITVIMST